MTAVMSPGSSPATSPPALSSPAASSTAHPALPPLITSPPARRSNLPRPMSHASKNRLSQYSTTGSVPSRSRPPSHIFPIYPSSLPYTLVRDFAYPPSHPLHYGPPPEPSRPPSGMTTPASEHHRLSDLPAWDAKTSWDTRSWSSSGFAAHRPADLPSIQFADGPPWSEDEDLQSPVVSSRHRKHKSASAGAYGKNRASRDAAAQPGPPDNYDRERGYYVGTSSDGSERYYVNQGNEANGPGGEYVTYPPDQARHGGVPGGGNSNAYQLASQQPRQFGDATGYASDDSSTCSSPGLRNTDESRYSRDYQFTITSPDEEMHGKAVALFDFERENESELPLVEGQIIWVSYRYGQGWLVAEDPKTQESGLVPEEYVRLLRDIEGGMTSLTGNLVAGDGSPASPSNDVGTPTQAEHSSAHQFPHSPAATTASGVSATSTSTTIPVTNTTTNPSSATTATTSSSTTPSTTTTTSSSSTTATNGYHQPVVSTFSTSSKDLDPYPQHLLGTQAGQPPPQVVHYHGQRGGSQANTPTLAIHQGFGSRRASQDTTTGNAAGVGQGGKKGEVVGGGLETLPDARLDTGHRKRESR
ncbi:hypothetical protein C8A05DRAFT_43874 [Staphylotrichum tortipilum]|uniref:SH3 domain-containing protein n=1 Tax=Staphylotrichum tortipilum TaxID=2831512 RepID=A0AAN6RU98_9PEZI|nr:hypothetical protein C8A05DRAFT_43874 [Staphylotrichum longicolle]